MGTCQEPCEARGNGEGYEHRGMRRGAAAAVPTADRRCLGRHFCRPPHRQQPSTHQ